MEWVRQLGWWHSIPFPTVSGKLCHPVMFQSPPKQFIYIYLMVKYTIYRKPIGWSLFSQSTGSVGIPGALRGSLGKGLAEAAGRGMRTARRRWGKAVARRHLVLFGKSGIFLGEIQGKLRCFFEIWRKHGFLHEETKKSVFWSMIGSFYWRCYLKESERKMGREARMLELSWHIGKEEVIAKDTEKHLKGMERAFKHGLRLG